MPPSKPVQCVHCLSLFTSSTDVLPKWFELYDSETGQPFYLETDSLAVTWELPEKVYGVPLPFSSADDAKLRNTLGRPPSRMNSSAGNSQRNTMTGSEEDDIISFAVVPEPQVDSDDEAGPLRLPKAAPRPKPNLIKTEKWFKSVTGCSEEEFALQPTPFTLFPDGSLGRRFKH